MAEPWTGTTRTSTARFAAAEVDDRNGISWPIVLRLTERNDGNAPRQFLASPVQVDDIQCPVAELANTRVPKRPS